MCRYIIRHLEEIHHMVNMCRYDLRHLEEVHHMVNMCRYDIRHLEEVHELLTVSPKKKPSPEVWAILGWFHYIFGWDLATFHHLVDFSLKSPSGHMCSPHVVPCLAIFSFMLYNILNEASLHQLTLVLECSCTTNVHRAMANAES